MLWKGVGGSIWSIHCQKSTLRYVNTITNILLWWFHATYNATINILEEGGQLEKQRWRMTKVADANCGGQRMIGQRTAMGKDKRGQWEKVETAEW